MTVSVSLGEICNFIGGGTPSRKIKEYWNGDIPWATVKDFQSDRISKTLEFVSREGLENSASKVVPSGTVLLVTRVGLGKVAIADVDIAINQDIKAVFPSEDILPEFLLWALKHLGPKIEAKGTGATVKGVTLRDIKEMEVPLPPLDEQRRIVGILNRAAKIERLRAKAADRLREFVPALFIKMFGGPVENPMGWEVRMLEEICISAQYGTSKKASEHVGGIPILRMGNVTYDGYLDCDSINLKYAQLEDSEIKKYVLHSGDILFNRTNSKDLVGKTGIWDGRFEAVPASYFIRLRVDHAVIHPTYLWAFMNSSAVKQRLFEMARGAIGQANINAKELKSIRVPVPSIDEQLRFAKMVAVARTVSNLCDSSSNVALALSTSLIARVLGQTA